MERKGQVLILLVEQALGFQDYKAASMHCQELMATGEVIKWGLPGVVVVEILSSDSQLTMKYGTSDCSISFKNQLHFVCGSRQTSPWNRDVYSKYCM